MQQPSPIDMLFSQSTSAKPIKAGLIVRYKYINTSANRPDCGDYGTVKQVQGERAYVEFPQIHKGVNGLVAPYVVSGWYALHEIEVL